MRILRPLSFSLMGVIILLLIAGSVVEQLFGTDAAVRYVYTAPWTIVLWTGAALSGMAYLLTERVYKQWVTALLHFSFVVILGGALTTHLYGRQGEVHLRLPEASASAAADAEADTASLALPFGIRLTDFSVEYYPGTHAPMDYISRLEVTDNGLTTQGQVSMNHIFSYRHWRFYQSRYDTDGLGTTLRVSYDPWGIGITYTGYALLLLSMLLFFLQKRTRFRSLLRQLRGQTVAAVAVLLFIAPLTAKAADGAAALPPTLNRQTAAELCNLYVYYNDRVCPLQTLARDFTVKLCGKPSYRGLTAEEVFCGWLFFYDQWAQEPCIKIKGKATRRTLGIEGKFACLNDFTGAGRYKLQPALMNGDKDARAADEKFRLVSMVCTASMLRIYPVDGSWYSWVNALPEGTPFEDWQFVKGSMEYVSLCIARNANGEAQQSLRKIRAWQQHADSLPTEWRFRAEKFYNSLNFVRPLAMGCATLGLVLFFVCSLLLARGRRLDTWMHFTLTGLMAALFVFLTGVLALRWMISGHVPLSNGHETMQFLAWVSALLTTVFSLGAARPDSAAQPQLILPFGFLVCGMTLMVSMMSSANPQITNLMPVLQSPLLTVHVVVIMLAYCLLAFVMLNGLTAGILWLHDRTSPQIKRLQLISQLLLYPAVFCLTIGIFIGAVWANISWGRYWGWDPKEVWALITMLVYAALLHTGSLRFLRRPMVFHLYSVVAFLFVLFTYFGVNFILGGLHSYA
ncbi:MAG: cytochrome c biogenesis protein CcsA [Paludibacteraceae bacterium]|nr:cytochrome c biogenesis protein CcsA [Paludibacteraceae bacterium]